MDTITYSGTYIITLTFLWISTIRTFQVISTYVCLSKSGLSELQLMWTQLTNICTYVLNINMDTVTYPVIIRLIDISLGNDIPSLIVIIYKKLACSHANLIYVSS